MPAALTTDFRRKALTSCKACLLLAAANGATGIAGEAFSPVQKNGWSGRLHAEGLCQQRAAG